MKGKVGIIVFWVLLTTACVSQKSPSTARATLAFTKTPLLTLLTPSLVTPELISTKVPPELSFTPTATTESSALQGPTSTEPPQPTLDPVDWQEWPIIPDIGIKPGEIYQRGLEMGNNPHSFSKIGDCGSTPAWFLGDFDRGPRFYRLGEHKSLQPVIDAFTGSYDRTSLAAKAGFNASSVFAPMWADRAQCEANETPLACEYRNQKPSFAFIMLGSNDVYHLDNFETQMRKIIEFSIEKGVIPILSTKADNLEGDGSINATLAHLALDYDIPLLNYWKAVQSLPDHGLQEDGVHLTWAPNRFDDPQAMQSAWAVRNLITLQVLDRVWRSVTQNSEEN